MPNSIRVCPLLASNRSVVENSFKLKNMSTEDTAYLQKIAHRVVKAEAAAKK